MRKLLRILKEIGFIIMYLGYASVLFINMIVPYDQIYPYTLKSRLFVAGLLGLVFPALFVLMLRSNLRDPSE